MKIAVFTDTYKPEINGVANTIHQQMLSLAERGHEVKIVCPLYGNEKRKENINSRVSVERFSSIPFWAYPEVRISKLKTKRALEIVRKFKPGIIHTHTPFIIGMAGVKCAKKLDIPLVGTYHTLFNEFATYISPLRLTKLDKLYEKINHQKNKKNQIKVKKHNRFTEKLLWSITNKFYNRCNLVIVPTKVIKKELVKNKMNAPIEVISGGIDLAKFKSRKKRISKKVRLLHVGRSSYERNINVILQAMKIVVANRKNVYLDIVGSGPALNSLKMQASYLDLDKNVKFLGFVPDKKLHKAYKNSDIFVIASTVDTLGLVILEAMAYSLPVVGVNKYAIPKVVKHNINGYIVKPYDHNAMAEKLLHLISNKDLRFKMSQNSMNLVKEHSLSVVTDKLEQTYEKIKEKTC